MLINAELLLQYQRCQRRPYLDTYGDYLQKDGVNELLLKLQQDKIAHQQSVITSLDYHQPNYPSGNWEAGAIATWELMEQGVDFIHRGLCLTTYANKYTLLSRPDLLVKQPGRSKLGDWTYIPADIQLGKRPKQEYQVVIAFHSEVLAILQEVSPNAAWLILRHQNVAYEVNLEKWTPRMREILADYIQVIESESAPEVFIARQKCSLCSWYSSCYDVAQSQQHLSLLPGVTPIRYIELQKLSITTLSALAATSPHLLANLNGFDLDVAVKLVVQAESALMQKALILPNSLSRNNLIFTAPVEIYFDIEAQPDLNLHYLLGVLVVNREADTEQFYSFLAETPEEEQLIWQQFLDLVGEYPQAPIYHFCVYEVDTVKHLGKLYHTPYSVIQALVARFIDVYAQLIQSVALPVESYALKAIAHWVGFEWREKSANGAKCIYWYDQWLETGDRTLLKTIQSYNEDDCRATRSVKDWLVNFAEINLLGV